MPAAADPSDDRPVASPLRPPTQMTHHRIAQIAEKVNPKSPEIPPQEGRFPQNRLLHSRRLPAHRQSVSRSSRTTNEHPGGAAVTEGRRSTKHTGGWVARSTPGSGAR